MAWEDRTLFEVITFQFKIYKREIINKIRNEMKLSSFKIWRERVQDCSTKNSKLNVDEIERFKCTLQKTNFLK